MTDELYFSRDGGRTWPAARQRPLRRGTLPLSASAVSGTTLFGIFFNYRPRIEPPSHTLVRSDDGGRSWTVLHRWLNREPASQR